MSFHSLIMALLYIILRSKCFAELFVGFPSFVAAKISFRIFDVYCSFLLVERDHKFNTIISVCLAMGFSSSERAHSVNTLMDGSTSIFVSTRMKKKAQKTLLKRTLKII
jgi:hypothetical protein